MTGPNDGRCRRRDDEGVANRVRLRANNQLVPELMYQLSAFAVSDWQLPIVALASHPIRAVATTVPSYPQIEMRLDYPLGPVLHCIRLCPCQVPDRHCPDSALGQRKRPSFFASLSMSNSSKKRRFEPTDYRTGRSRCIGLSWLLPIMSLTSLGQDLSWRECKCSPLLAWANDLAAPDCRRFVVLSIPALNHSVVNCAQ
jgi:hypothetical protein